MQQADPSNLIMIMLDGFGFPPEGWAHSLYSELCSPEFIQLFESDAIAIDACLGVEGIPQSATGQTALFCGFNAPAAMGRHIHAFPGERLCGMIRERNIFKAIIDRGGKPVFANAYLRHNLLEMAASRFRSVTTVMTASTIGHAFLADDLRRSEAVFHDITNVSAPEEAEVPLITPETAAENLLHLSARHDFTLFEYFLTDRIGHKSDRQLLAGIMNDLDRFICVLTRQLPPQTRLLVTADHGNCEEIASSRHTCNPVPLLVYPHYENIPVTAIDQVYDFILSLMLPTAAMSGAL